ncbi:MAG: molybdopterin-guanine dinucleotide biosynthesis protein B [Candidatus Thermoplasmatota archaeon]
MIKNIAAVVGIYGESNSGKTGLITRLIEKLKEQGYNVAVIKKTDKKISIDTEGKDTYRYAQKGSDLVVFSTKIETSYIVKEKQDTEDIIQQIKDSWNIDVILIEGSNHPDVEKIKVGGNVIRENTIMKFNSEEDFSKIIDFIRQRMEDVKMKDKVSVKVNDKDIPLTDFPSEFIRNTLEGMLKSLKGVDEDIEKIDIVYEK